jgi:hypothetical protein
MPTSDGGLKLFKDKIKWKDQNSVQDNYIIIGCKNPNAHCRVVSYEVQVLYNQIIVSTVNGTDIVRKTF